MDNSNYQPTQSDWQQFYAAIKPKKRKATSFSITYRGKPIGKTYQPNEYGLMIMEFRRLSKLPEYLRSQLKTISNYS